MELVEYPRELAVKIITRILTKQEYLDFVFSELTKNVSGVARAWLFDVCNGVLRWKGRLDWTLDTLSHKRRVSGRLRKILWIAAYQILNNGV